MGNYEKFKGRAPFRLEKAIVVVLIIIIAVLVIIPRNEREAEIEKHTTVIFIESIDIPQVELTDMNIPAPRPVIPVLSEDEDIEIDTALIDWIFDDPTLQDASPPPPKDADNDPDDFEFIPREVNPEPIGGYAGILKHVKYPEIAREAGIEGTVLVQCFIDKKGNVIKTVVVKGLEGTGLNEAAMDALKKTKFKPAIQRDKPVGVWMAIPVIFRFNTK